VRGPIQKGFLGYWVATTSQGQGHASRAVGLVLELMAGELGLHRAEAHTQMENLASHAVLRNNGFTPWGVAHAHIHIAGAWRDEVFWERTLTGH
jgi:ribosomal-protein-alanine N-acetyltransferase